MFCPENLTAFASAYLEGARQTIRPPPGLRCIVSLPPILVRQFQPSCFSMTRRIHASICSSGGTCRLRVYHDDVAHCWQMFAPLVPEATESLREAAAFIEQYVGGGAGGRG